jgi:hypothetical protein
MPRSVYWLPDFAMRQALNPTAGGGKIARRHWTPAPKSPTFPPRNRRLPRRFPVTTLTLATVLQMSILVAGADAQDSSSYAAAHRQSARTGQPMIVLVGADWCPACVEMKDQVLPKLQRRGVLRKVAFALVNFDRQTKLGRQLTGGGPIPQIIMYRRTRDGWRQRKLIGGQNVEAVSRFIREGVQLDERTKQAEGKQKPQTEAEAKTAG